MKTIVFALFVTGLIHTGLAQQSPGKKPPAEKPAPAEKANEGHHTAASWSYSVPVAPGSSTAPMCPEAQATQVVREDT